MDGVEISFPGSDLAKSSQLSRELRDKLRAEGVPDIAMTLERGQAGTMNAGEILRLVYEMANQFLEPATIALHVAVIANGIYELCRRGHSGVRIKLGSAILELRPGEIDFESIEKIRRTLTEAINASGSR